MLNPHSRFWQLAGCLPLATAAFSASAQTPQPALEQQQGDRWTFHHEHVLGTSLEVSVRATSLADAQKAEAAVLAAFDRDDAILSTWRADSEVSRWSRTMLQPVPVSPELLNVLAEFDHWRERTNGALDASVEAATRLWSRTTSEGRTPSNSEIAMAVEAMQQPHWKLDAEHGTAMRLSDVPLALASFTKSFITQRAAEAALTAGASGVMLNVGGDVIVRGSMTQTVAISDPMRPSENSPALLHVQVKDRAVATSGSYRRGFQLATASVSHLIDPRTALPASHVLSSTVIAQDATTAGALATAFSILPVEQSHALAASTPGVEYLLVLPSGEQVRSANWPAAPAYRAVAYSPTQARKKSATSGVWNPDYELGISLTLPRFDTARARRPYVAVWVEDADHNLVRTIALWTEKPRYLPDLKEWYREAESHRAQGEPDTAATLSTATRPPGTYTLTWDGNNKDGKPVKTGKYTICIEAAREHGGYDIQRQDFAFDNAKPQQATLPAAAELGASSFDYHKR